MKTMNFNSFIRLFIMIFMSFGMLLFCYETYLMFKEPDVETTLYKVEIKTIFGVTDTLEVTQYEFIKLKADQNILKARKIK